MTPDPYQGTSGGPGDTNNPQSWNRYAYVLGDPMNWFDPEGLDNSCPPGWICQTFNPNPLPSSPAPSDPPPPITYPSGPPPSPGGTTKNQFSGGPQPCPAGTQRNTWPGPCVPTSCPAGQALDGVGHCVTQGQYQLEVQCTEANNARNALLFLTGTNFLGVLLDLIPIPVFKQTSAALGAALAYDQLYISTACTGVPLLTVCR